MQKKQSHSPVFKQIENYIKKNYNIQKIAKPIYFDQSLSQKKSPRNRDLCSKTNRNISLEKLTCINHPEKKAKYFEILINKKRKNYCSKCAVKQAVLNHNIFEIQVQNDENSSYLSNKTLEQKQKQPQQQKSFQFDIDYFLQEIGQIQQTTNIYKNQIKQKQIQIEQQLITQQQLIEKQFKNAIQSMELEKKQIQQKLIEQYNINTNNLKKLDLQFIQNINEIQLIQTDIQNNKQNIVQNLDKEELKLIIVNYQNDLQNLIKFTSDVQNMTMEQYQIGINAQQQIFNQQVENLSIVQNKDIFVSFQENQLKQYFKTQQVQNESRFKML